MSTASLTKIRTSRVNNLGDRGFGDWRVKYIASHCAFEVTFPSNYLGYFNTVTTDNLEEAEWVITYEEDMRLRQMSGEDLGQPWA